MVFRRSKSWAIVAVLAVGLIALADEGGTPVRYDNYKVVRLQPGSWVQIDQIHAAGARLLSCIEGVGPVDYMVPPEAMDAVAGLGIPYAVLNDNLQRAIDAERASIEGAGAGNERDATWFTAYKTYDQIVSKLNAMQTDHPELATVIDAGLTLENRHMYGVRISGPGSNKPAVLFDAGVHAREWIAPMTVMWIADQLVYSTDPAIRALVDKVEFIIIPSDNPDGYVYSWGPDRMWRKNRRNNGDGSYGVDVNRNWGTGWGGEGASGSPSAEDYRGPAAFSEPETQALRDFIIAHPQIVSGISYHSYAELIMSPYGYTSALPPDNTTFLTLDAAMHDDIYAVHGLSYGYGPIYTTIYPASGNNVDWYYTDQGIFSFTIELRDTGTYGFQLPANQIIPTCEENFAAAMDLATWSSTPVKFEFPSGLPARITAGSAQTVQVKITSLLGSVDSASPRLYTRIGASGSFTEHTLTSLGGNLYEASLPATPCGSQLNYYFAAQTTTAVSGTSPDGAPGTTYSADAVLWQTVLADDMETDHGWTVGDTGDAATTGLWTRNVPQATAAQPGTDHTAGAGTICWVTDYRAGSSVGDYDVDGGKTTLKSPVLNLASYTSATITYWRWYSNNQGSAPNADTFRVDITNNGTTWVNAETVGPAGAEAGGGWYYHEFAAENFVTLTSQVRVRFVAEDAGSGSIVEAVVDDFNAAGNLACPSLPGDMNCDGAVNNQDIDHFVQALFDPAGYVADHDGSPYPPCDIGNGDFTGDGLINNQDIDGFVAALFG